MEYVTLSESEFATVFDPPENAAALNRTPPLAAVLATVVTPDPPATTILPVIVAEPMMENAVVAADLEPDEAAVQVIATRAAITLEVVSVTVGEA